ncbi:MAG: amidohydrolase family protein [Fimbriimonadaceae bacterium]
MTLRPYGLVIAGALELGLEVVVDESAPTRIEEIRPHTGVPDPYVLAPAFVNAHSHLEYHGLMAKLSSRSYWPWLREIAAAKRGQAQEQVREDCFAGARENRQTGVAVIAEHSDRPFSGEAMSSEGIGGVIFQEIIMIGEPSARPAKLAQIELAAEQNRGAFRGPVFRTPHAYFTVDVETLSEVGGSGEPCSIHVAETALESEFTRNGSGSIAEMLASLGLPNQPTGLSVVASLKELGLVRPGAQFVHCCDLSEDDISLLHAGSVSVAHCPRSNAHLACPLAPVREMLDAGLQVGLGLDSPASSGPVDMFAEMRSAMDTSVKRGSPLSPEEIWNMANSMGARSIPIDLPDWGIFKGSDIPLIKIHIPGARCAEDLIMAGRPDLVEWV